MWKQVEINKYFPEQAQSMQSKQPGRCLPSFDPVDD